MMLPTKKRRFRKEERIVIDMSTKDIVFPEKKHHSFHSSEGITEDLIIKILKANTFFKKSPSSAYVKRRYVQSANYYVTDLLQRFPPIRLTVTFLLKPNNIVYVTNAYLGSIVSKNSFEKEAKLYWRKEQ